MKRYPECVEGQRVPRSPPTWSSLWLEHETFPQIRVHCCRASGGGHTLLEQGGHQWWWKVPGEGQWESGALPSCTAPTVPWAGHLAVEKPGVPEAGRHEEAPEVSG
ncbi:hypothetical protein H1C71_012016 [Ictidomys tridecemlineatus]|nr:hypothetical protein H1C71_012016 [Ictidomys tridecemlineatus]